MWPSKSHPRVEDPDRLSRFLKALENVDWRNNEKLAYSTIFKALNDLIFHEILFYYRARKKQRLFSLLTRGAALLLGTLGVMIPLLAGANPEMFKSWAPYGYPLLVAAGSAILINRMFGATGGHIRYVTAQLELERITTKFRLGWMELFSASTNPSAFEAFRLLNAFVDDAYHVIQEETNVWGQSVSKALDDYERDLSSRTTPASPKPVSGSEDSGELKPSAPPGNRPDAE